jgi:hypothetical protein
MGFLSKLRGRKDDHEAWLTAHPGKSSTYKGGGPVISEAEEASVRSHMEQELEEQRSRRAKS